ncbi:MAG: hypothetical protein M1821_001549 [Bathelium mastoideum]|nr:MAG: hypothetical protein M1821_001549 [Bathelium mastoideum]
MPLNQPIPILFSGRNGALAKIVAERLAPEYDVVHISINHRADMTEIPAILHGRLVTPSFTGSNLYRAFSERRKPRAIVFSSSVPRCEVEAIKGFAEPDSDVKFIEYGKTDILRYGFPGTSATVRLLKDMLKAEEF